MRFVASLLLFSLIACSTPSHLSDADLNPLAERYVRLSLEIGTHEEGYIDAYFGPPDWKREAEAHPRPLPDLQAAAAELRASIEGLAARTHDPAALRRARALARYVGSAEMRMRMMQGERVPFTQEADALFGVTPELKPLSHYDEILGRLETIAPGEGPLSQRIAAFRARYAIPEDRLDAVLRAAIAECAARTRAHLSLPPGERFDLEFVTGQSWGAYNWYQGEGRSLIQVNGGLPIQIGTAVGYGCHEGYPGHHVQGIYAERLYRERGWVEFSIMPLYSPQGPLNEGGANYAVDLAFPGGDQLHFLQTVLFPLAGLDPGTAPAYRAMERAMADLAGARLTIAELYLDGQIDRERAIELTQRYSLVSRPSAERTIAFTDHYRSYVINYVSGEALVRNYVERNAVDIEGRWRAYESLLLQPTLPENLQ